MPKERINYVEKAAFQEASVSHFARRLGVSQAAAWKWVKRGWVPLRRAQEMEALYGIDRKLLMNPFIADLTTSE